MTMDDAGVIDGDGDGDCISGVTISRNDVKKE